MENETQFSLIRKLAQRRAPVNGVNKCVSSSDRGKHAGVIRGFGYRTKAMSVADPAPERHIAVARVDLS